MEPQSKHLVLSENFGESSVIPVPEVTTKSSWREVVFSSKPLCRNYYYFFCASLRKGLRWSCDNVVVLLLCSLHSMLAVILYALCTHPWAQGISLVSAVFCYLESLQAKESPQAVVVRPFTTHLQGKRFCLPRKKVELLVPLCEQAPYIKKGLPEHIGSLLRSPKVPLDEVVALIVAALNAKDHALEMLRKETHNQVQEWKIKALEIGALARGVTWRYMHDRGYLNERGIMGAGCFCLPTTIRGRSC